MTHATVLYHRQRASKTRNEILRTSMDIASAEGLEGLSIGRLATELQMSKTGIFAHFGSKEQLQLATVEAAKQVFLEQVVQPSLTHPRGIPRLCAMLENWIGYVERVVFRGGCFFSPPASRVFKRPGPLSGDIAAPPQAAWIV